LTDRIIDFRPAKLLIFDRPGTLGFANDCVML
jgi:hypothetical protein